MASTFVNFCIFCILFLKQFCTFECFVHEEDDPGLEFCEGHLYRHVGLQECPGGISLGNQTPPSCICLRGIYRAHMDNCEVTDGFANDVCVLPYQKLPGHTEKKPKINRIRFLKFLVEPDWDKTHAVVEARNGDWKLVTRNEQGTSDDVTVDKGWFYTINGKVYISKKKEENDTQVLCVEPSDELLSGTKVCKVTQASNRKTWLGSSVILKVRKPKACWLEFGDMTLLGHEPCVRPLLPRNDECISVCVREGRVRPPTWPNCPASVQRVVWDNEYMERQLKQYIVQSQVKGKPKMEAGEPVRTMELMQLLVQVTSQYCDEKFVQPDWLTWMSDLFYLLHKGNKFKYPEYLTEQNFKAIKKILETCLSGSHRVRLTNFVDGMRKDKRCQRNDIGPAVAYCKNGDDACLKPVPVQPINEKMEHKIREKQYVPEVAWNILDATQAICFREFNASYRMFHVLQQAVENLFTHEIKKFWYHPPSNHKERVKTMISGKRAEEKIGNLEICIGSAYHALYSEAVAKYGPRVTTLKRLTRPPLLNYFRKRRSIGDNSQDNDQGVAKPNPNGSFGKTAEVFCGTAPSCERPNDDNAV